MMTIYTLLQVNLENLQELYTDLPSRVVNRLQ